MRLSEEQVLAQIRTVTVAELRGWVAEGWIAPAAGEAGPRYDDVDLARIRLVCELRDDLALPSDSLPVVLSLIDQLHGLRRELRALARAVDQQPDEIREEVRAAYRRWRERAGMPDAG